MTGQWSQAAIQVLLLIPEPTLPCWGESLMWTMVQNGPNFGAGTGERPWVELENLA